MADTETALAQKVALFRLSVLGDLVHLAPGSPGVGEAIARRASADYDIPGTLRTRVAAETIRGWLKAYRKAGFEALVYRSGKCDGPGTTRRVASNSTAMTVGRARDEGRFAE
jgi:hypothetical protein